LSSGARVTVSSSRGATRAGGWGRASPAPSGSGEAAPPPFDPTGLTGVAGAGAALTVTAQVSLAVFPRVSLTRSSKWSVRLPLGTFGLVKPACRDCAFAIWTEGPLT
jgi:hypothetical protein